MYVLRKIGTYLATKSLFVDVFLVLLLQLIYEVSNQELLYQNEGFELLNYLNLFNFQLKLYFLKFKSQKKMFKS